jgi:deoxyribose-phosphate aldolase
MDKFWTAKDIAKMIDHSLLNPVMTLKDISDGCAIAKEYNVATVCVKPSELPLAVSELTGSGVIPTTVIGFPHGANKTSVKVFEAREAMADGARELDMVINIGRLLSGDYDYVENDIRAVVEAAHAGNAIVKVILENCYLTDEQKRAACGICEKAGADFVKTSTGYGSSGATIEDLNLMRKTCSKNVRIKAAGGVRTLEKALEVRATGAERFGATATKVIMDEALKYDAKRNRLPWRLVQNKIVRYPGGRELDRFRGIAPARDDGRPEAWVGSDTRTKAARMGKADPDDGCAECILPDGTRHFLYRAIEADPKAILGSRHMEINGPQLGFLVKLLDAERQLSLQSHPNREYAKTFFNSDYGKEESWYIIGMRDDVAEPPYVYLGFKEGVTREMFEAAYNEQDIATLESYCHKIQVELGDAFFIKAGVPHAVGPGCFLVEVQEPSDITVGWRKPVSGTDAEQETHKQILLGCYAYDGAGAEENLGRYRIPPRIIRRGNWGYEELILGQGQTDYFSFTKLRATKEVDLISTGFPQVAVVTEGEGILLCGGTAMRIKQGDEFFFPYATDRIRIIPSRATAGSARAAGAGASGGANAKTGVNAKTSANAKNGVSSKYDAGVESGISIVLCNPGQVYYDLET